MMFIKLAIIIIVLLILVFSRKFLKYYLGKKVLNANKLKTLNKKNLNKWKNLTKKERYNLSKQESISYFNKRKVLLEEIRKEYKKISRGNSE